MSQTSQTSNTDNEYFLLVKDLLERSKLTVEKIICFSEYSTIQVSFTVKKYNLIIWHKKISSTDDIIEHLKELFFDNYAKSKAKGISHSEKELFLCFMNHNTKVFDHIAIKYNHDYWNKNYKKFLIDN
ncbi:42927_t:CDS:2 [Gigaspora margarita]|uniref:42927_t:CDS:1 n=1 Tax=Gigaspora margarita TaxID=4874 RepID=A0ABN7WN81_GIGMA|nr:42927_t:CDS:2 [Gigaspora margarita]